jgi:hypothetical protein
MIGGLVYAPPGAKVKVKIADIKPENDLAKD